jgi:hypothetical protein
MRTTGTAIVPKYNTRVGAEMNTQRRELRSLRPQRGSGTFTKHTSEGAIVRSKARATDEGGGTTYVVPRWG